MQYICLIYGDETLVPGDEPRTSGTQVMADYWRSPSRSGRAATWSPANALQPTTTATTVRVRNGETLVTDGPFAETKEQLGGYYLIEAKDLDEAIEIAARIPGAPHGSIEVRPVVVFEE